MEKHRDDGIAIIHQLLQNISVSVVVVGIAKIVGKRRLLVLIIILEIRCINLKKSIFKQSHLNYLLMKPFFDSFARWVGNIAKKNQLIFESHIVALRFNMYRLS